MSELAVVHVGGGAVTADLRSGRVGGVCEQVLRDYFSPQSPVSEEMVRLALKRMAADLGVLPVSGRIEDVEWYNITASDFSDLMYLWRNKLSSVSVKRYLSALRGLSRQCFLNGMMPGEQIARIKEVKLPKGTNRVGRGMRVDRMYQKKLIDNCMMDERMGHGLRDAAMLAILFGSGIRRAEAASLKETDIDFESGEVTLTVKGGNTVLRFLSSWAIPYIKDWIDFKEMQECGGGYLLVRINKSGRIGDSKLTGRGLLYLFEERSIKAGLPFIVRPHDARRTMGTEMIEEHGELIAQRVLGHSNLNTTRIYDKRGDDVLRNIMSERK